MSPAESQLRFRSEVKHAELRRYKDLFLLLGNPTTKTITPHVIVKDSNFSDRFNFIQWGYRKHKTTAMLTVAALLNLYCVILNL